MLTNRKCRIKTDCTLILQINYCIFSYINNIFYATYVTDLMFDVLPIPKGTYRKKILKQVVATLPTRWFRRGQEARPEPTN